MWRPRFSPCSTAPASPMCTRRSDPILVVPIELDRRARRQRLGREQPLAHGLVSRGSSRRRSSCPGAAAGRSRRHRGRTARSADGRRSRGARCAGQPLRYDDGVRRRIAHRAADPTRAVRCEIELRRAPTPGRRPSCRRRSSWNPARTERLRLTVRSWQVIAAIEDDWKRRTAGQASAGDDARRGRAACRSGGLGADKA